MSVHLPWNYVQARLQARHGDRLQEGDWRALEAARSFDQFLERARATSLRRFTELLNAGMSSHAVERVLQTAWRHYIAEIAGWSAPHWQPAVLWTAQVPDLPALDALLRGDASAWMQQDPVFADFLETDVAGRAVSLAKSPMAPLLPANGREPTLARRWYAHWRSLWPRRATEQRPLAQLAETVAAHVERLGRAGAQETSGSYRRELARAATRMFRQHGGSPIAVFCHLVLVALDLERLRGGLVRRLLFAPERAKESS
jgi:hypothetical protein